MAATLSLESLLCTRCGLCCNGSFFADIEISAKEALHLEAAGLEIEEEEVGALLLQPCGALKGTRCGMYAARPQCCRTFECALLKRARRGEISIEVASEKIVEARFLLKRDRAAFDAMVDETFLGRAVSS